MCKQGTKDDHAVFHLILYSSRTHFFGCVRRQLNDNCPSNPSPIITPLYLKRDGKITPLKIY